MMKKSPVQAQGRRYYWSADMRMFILLMVVIFASSLSFFASADSSRQLSLKKPEPQTEALSATSRCAKKIALGDGETACLMLKRKGRA
ncbi:MAG: hypothetical protein CTY15_04090 [Methylocystis sp.]|nr:MAG: hypothetical protein CTY15_04090 [Methylocystis sp.]